jgi:pimeloyl-ACP methyl ester carboxylesterase
MGLNAEGLDVLRVGKGPRVVLVHGTGGSREETWSDQMALKDRYTLLLPDRRGYGRSDPATNPDFERDGEDIADLLGDGAHLVGFSYGGIGCLIAADIRLKAVMSLTLIEPVAFGLVRENGAVDNLVERLRAVYRAAPSLSPEEFDVQFDRALGFDATDYEADPVTRQRLDAARRERPPWEAVPAMQGIAGATFPKLVISGAWHPAFDAVCDEIERAIGGRRAVLPGGHGAQHRTEASQEIAGTWDSASHI